MILADTSIWVDHLRRGNAKLVKALDVTDDEALAFIERRALMGRGIGYVDVHLMASAAISGATLWTLDARLSAVVATL